MVFGKGFGCWNTIPTSRRSATGSVPFENTETPSSRMSPPWRVCGISSFSRFTERRKVLLPQPDGPISAVTARRGTAIVTSNSAWVAPYQKLYACTSRIGVGRSDRRAAGPPPPPPPPAGGGGGGGGGSPPPVAPPPPPPLVPAPLPSALCVTPPRCAAPP